MLVGLVLLVVVAMRILGGGISRDTTSGVGGSPRPARSRAREILDERYARGELSAEEYHELQMLGEDR
jgi:putative membrane protein